MSRGQQKPTYNADVAALFADLKQRAENIVQSDFPRKVRLFDDLLNTDQFATATLESLLNDTRAQHASTSATNPAIQQQQLQLSGNDAVSTSSPVTGLARARAANARDDEAQNDDDTESVSAATKRKHSVSSEPKSNHLDVNRNTPVRLHVHSMIDTVRPHLLCLSEDTKKVALWISLMHPHLDYGNNSGFNMQLNAQRVVTDATAAASEYLQKIGTYHQERVSIERNGSLCANVDDFILANDDLDWNAFVHMRQAIRALRNQYATMYDVISKNWGLIRHPLRDDRTPFMY